MNNPLRDTIYRCDEGFEGMLGLIETSTEEELAAMILNAFRNLPQATRVYFEEYLKKYPYWGSLDDSSEDHEFIANRARALRRHISDSRLLYHRLGDYRSRLTLYVVIHNWFTFSSLGSVIEPSFSQYFDLDIMRCGTDEVFIDAGAFTGDSTQSYISNYGADNYKRIYCYEITPDMQAALSNSLAGYRGIVIRPVGLSDHSGEIYVSPNEDSSANMLAERGTDAVRIVTLDADVQEAVSFIKMDIEGGERAALRGCKGHIQKNAPKLAISVYHNNEDIWEIPRMIDEMRPGYRFYLRYHGQTLFPTELTLLAVHEDQ